MRALALDLRCAARSLLRSPVFVLATVLTLALGVGTLTALYSLLKGVVLDPLPYPESRRLVWLRHDAPGLGFHGLAPSPGLYGMYQESSRSLQEVGLWSHRRVTVTGAGEPRILPAVAASSGLFRLLGVRPLHGRLFAAEEDRPGSRRVALLSHRLWQRSFHGDPEAVGRSLRLDGEVHVVVGVLPEDFRFPEAATQLWIDSELATEPSAFGAFGGLEALGLRKPRATLEDVKRDLDARIAELLGRTDPKERQLIAGAGLVAHPIPLKDRFVGSVRDTLWILFAAGAILLLVAGSNIAHLLLARARARRREIATRMALGAGRGQLARTFLAEGALLAALGGVLGLGLARAGLEALIRAAPATVPRLHELGLDGGVLTFIAGATAAAGLFFAGIPLLFSRRRLSEGLRARRPGDRRRRPALAGGSLVVALQLAVALVMVVGALLMVRSFQQLKAVDPGFDTARIARFRLTLPPSRYSAPEAATFHGELRDRLSALPGVFSVASGKSLPLEGVAGGIALYGEGETGDPGGQGPLVAKNAVTSDFFRTFEIPLLEGRIPTFEEGASGPPQVVLNRSLAARFGPLPEVIGKRLLTDRSSLSPSPQWMTVAGVVEDHETGLVSGATPMIFLPLEAPEIGGLHDLAYGVRTALPPMALAGEMRALVRQLDPALALEGLETLEEVARRQSAPTAFVKSLLSLAATVTLALAAVGIFGILAYRVRLRRHELGVRFALGARPADVRRLILGQAAKIATLGLAVGLPASLLLAKSLEGLLFEVPPTDLAAHLAAAVTLSSAVALAAYFPARAACRIPPVEALKEE